VSDPLVHVTNFCSRDLFIAPDPNWDDQVLLFDGERLTEARRLQAKQSATLSTPMGPDGGGGEYLMGVIFADGIDYEYGAAGAYQIAIGQQPETGVRSHRRIHDQAPGLPIHGNRSNDVDDESHVRRCFGKQNGHAGLRPRQSGATGNGFRVPRGHVASRVMIHSCAGSFLKCHSRCGPAITFK
jgi:hypothetical protein